MIAAIERAMLARLAAADQANLFGGRLNAIASYAGELSDAAVAVQYAPALWLAYAGETEPREDGPETWHAAATFMLFCFVESARADGFSAARLGEAADEIGSYRVLQVARAALAGATFGLKIDPIRPGAITSEDQADGRSIYSLVLTTGYQFASAPEMPVDQLGDFMHLHLDWDIEPTGEVVPPLPAEQADQRDDIYLIGGSPS